MPTCIDSKFIYVWSGIDFPYVNLLSVLSTAKNHPEAEINVYVFGERPRTVWFDQLSSIPRVSIVHSTPHDLFRELPSHLERVADTFEGLPSSALSAKSNILRYALLFLHGGVYLDFDVLVVRAMDDLLHAEAFVGEELVWADDEARLLGHRWIYLAPRNILWLLSHCAMWVDSHLFGGAMRIADRLRPSFGAWSRYQMNNAVMGAVKKSPLIEELLMRAIDADTSVRYATGPTLVDNVLRDNPMIAVRRPADDFYAVPPGQTYRLFYDQRLTLPASAYLIHYAASNHAGFVAEYHPMQQFEYEEETVLGRILRDLNAEFSKLDLPQHVLVNHA